MILLLKNGFFSQGEETRNGFHCSKWTRQLEFKSWTRLWVSLRANVLEKNKNLPLLPAKGKIVRRIVFFSYVKATDRGEGKLWILTNFTPLENWPCTSSCVSWKDLGKYILVTIDVYLLVYNCISSNIASFTRCLFPFI